MTRRPVVRIMRDTDRQEDSAYTQRTPAYTRERLTDLFLQYHQTVPKPPRYNKGSRRFECGDKACGPGWKTVSELERHYAEQHPKPQA